MSGFNIADMFEAAVDVMPEREIVVAGDRRLTYRVLEDRANRLGSFLRERGVGRDGRVAVLAANCAEWVETLVAAFKVRAIPVNVNHRYVEDELRYLLTNSEAEVLVCQREYAPRVAAVAGDVTTLRLVLVVEDGADAPLDGLDRGGAEVRPYEAALAEAPPDRSFEPRSGDDRYVLYTGGTTGAPKGVLWTHEDFFFACLQGGAGAGAAKASDPLDLARRAVAQPPTRVLLCIGPIHHASGQWGLVSSLLMGARVVFYAEKHFDPHGVWRIVEDERVTNVALTGDGMARPLAEALATGRPGGGRYDTSSVMTVGSGGAILSAAVQRQLRDLLPGVVLTNVVGASETGVIGHSVLDQRDLEDASRPRFELTPDATILDENLRPLPPDSAEAGLLAVRGHVPLGYLNDPERSARTFPVIGGVRWAVMGDNAVYDRHGGIRLLGRGSGCINTGGEKVYPEEVESVLKSHPSVYDAVVVGAPDDRWGQRVVAIVEGRDGRAVDPDDLAAHVRAHLANYKAPKEVRVVERIVRLPSGKPDYRWAAEVQRAGATSNTRPSDSGTTST